MPQVGDIKSDTITLPSAIERYFEVALYLLVLNGFGTLAGTGGLDLLSVLLAGLALLVRGYFLVIRQTVLISERWTTYLTLAYVVFYLIDFLFLSRSFLNSTLHLVLFGMVVRLFSVRRERDHYMLAILSFLMVLAAAILTVDSSFLLSFAGFMVTAVVTLVLMEMRHSSAAATIHAGGPNEQQAYRRMAFSLLGAAPLLMALILIAGAAIFFILPRVSSRYLSAYAPRSDVATGFSDSVDLGRIGQIQQSNAVVMHIQIDGDNLGSHDLKWRGVALSSFNGHTWLNPFPQSIAPRLPDGSFWLVPARERLEAGNEKVTVQAARPIHYHVIMEPIGTNVFFLASKPDTLEGNYRMVAVDRAGAVYNLDLDRPVSQYEASSNIAQPAVEQLRAASGTNPESAFTYLQLPTLDPRVPRLAEEITAGANNNYDKARAIERYLASHYGYTLQLPRSLPRDPLANFLFERKTGHCEYFASAMAVMLRTLQIPSRLVNGFRSSEFNDLTSNYVVRASNAHAWVEAYFPGYGWVAFDPTPALATPVHEGWSRATLYVDALASFWREWVINYDATHQSSLAREATRSSHVLLDDVRSWAQRRYLTLLNTARGLQGRMARSPRDWLAGGLLVACLLIVLANGRRILVAIRNRSLRRHPERAPRFAATIWYERLIRFLARRGWRKSPVQTPGEFAAGIEDAKLRARVARFTRHYESARFGDSVEDARKLPGLYEEIKSGSPN